MSEQISSRIDKHTKIEEAKEILRCHGVDLTKFTMLALGLMVTSCEYIEIRGFGREAKIFQF